MFDSFGIPFSALTLVSNNYFNSSPTGPFTYGNTVYSVSDQLKILATAQASWFLAIVVGQAVHIWTCRTIRISIFQTGFCTNIRTTIGVLIAISLGIFLVYCPGLQTILMAYNPPSLFIFYASLLSIGCIIPWTEGRKWLFRNYWINSRGL